jgi:transposase
MFLKRCRRKKDGKKHVYWQLVESYRTPRGSRHRVVAYLGELSRGEREGWARLGAMLDGKAVEKAKQLMLFEAEGEEGKEAVPETVEVNVKGVEVTRTRDFGEVYLGLCLWRMLGLQELLAGLIPAGREQVGWEWMACVLTMARWVEPSSELHVEDTWYERTALSDLLGVSSAQVNDTRLYRTMDEVLPLKAQIEAHLKNRLGELFRPDYELLLYDVTSTYFEGEAEKNPQAERGYSRDSRSDCKQVLIGLVVTSGGFPVGYEVFAGNRADVTTLEEIVEAMEAKYGRARRVWVLDRGLVSEEKLGFLRGRGAGYLVGTPKGMLKQFERALVERAWVEVREGVQVKLVESPEGEETFVLCRSQDRGQKERGIRERFGRRIEEGLEKMARTLAGAKRKQDSSVVERRIGRLLQKNWRSAGGYDIKVEPDKTRPSGLRLTWSRDGAWETWAELSEGCYLLRTNVRGKAPEELWRMYMQLVEVEEAFRTQKSELKIRPIWHQMKDRVQGHILFSFLAYALWKTLQAWMERAGLGRGARTVVEEFSRIKACDVVLPTSSGRPIKVCCVTRPDGAQRALLDRLGLRLPERLGRPAWVPAPSTPRANVV